MTETTHQKTTFYRRWSLTKTQRRGYEPGDMTVSATWEEGREPTYDQMVDQARQCIVEAQDAATELNAMDAQVTQLKAGTSQ
jgi:hypothetical protein